mgnify:CR=1 FL=1
MGKSASKKKTAAASTAGDDESARGRLRGAATHLFCKYGINATGQVTGASFTTGDSEIHAFLYGGTLNDLGTLGGTHS